MVSANISLSKVISFTGQWKFKKTPYRFNDKIWPNRPAIVSYIGLNNLLKTLR